MKRDAIFDLLCRLSDAAGLPRLAWREMSARDWHAAVTRARSCS